MKQLSVTLTGLKILELVAARDQALENPQVNKSTAVGQAARTKQHMTMDELDQAMAPTPVAQDVTHLVQNDLLAHPVLITGKDGAIPTINDEQVKITEEGVGVLELWRSGKGKPRPDPGPASLRRVDNDDEFRGERLRDGEKDAGAKTPASPQTERRGRGRPKGSRNVKGRNAEPAPVPSKSRPANPITKAAQAGQRSTRTEKASGSTTSTESN